MKEGFPLSRMDADKRRPSRRPRKLPWPEIGLLVTAVFFVLGLSELFISRLVSIHSFRYRLRPERLSFHPGSVGRISRPGNFDVRFVANNFGYHDVPRSMKKTGKRILVIGDSFVEAVQISDPADLFTSWLERLIARGESGSWEVLPMGMSGQGTAQYSILYERFGRAFRPDIVVIVTVYNDFWNNMSVLPRYDIDETGRFRFVPGPTLQFPEWKLRLQRFLNRFDTYHALRTVAYVLRQREILREDRQEVRAARMAEGRAGGGGEDEIPDVQWRYYEALLSRMRDAVEADGARFLQVISDTANLNGPDPVAEKILTICARHGIVCLSLRPKFRQEHLRTGADGRWKGDAHWDPRGHQWAAAALYERLRRLGWLRKGEEVQPGDYTVRARSPMSE